MSKLWMRIENSSHVVNRSLLSRGGGAGGRSYCLGRDTNHSCRRGYRCLFAIRKIRCLLSRGDTDIFCQRGDIISLLPKRRHISFLPKGDILRIFIAKERTGYVGHLTKTCARSSEHRIGEQRGVAWGGIYLRRKLLALLGERVALPLLKYDSGHFCGLCLRAVPCLRRNTFLTMISNHFFVVLAWYRLVHLSENETERVVCYARGTFFYRVLVKYSSCISQCTIVMVYGARMVNIV